MIEAFERHLQASAFARKAEKATTVEEQIKFCQEFLDNHRKSLPPINLGGDHYNLNSGVESHVTTYRDRDIKALTVSYSVNEYNMMMMSGGNGENYRSETSGVPVEESNNYASFEMSNNEGTILTPVNEQSETSIKIEIVNNGQSSSSSASKSESVPSGGGEPNQPTNNNNNNYMDGVYTLETLSSSSSMQI